MCNIVFALYDVLDDSNRATQMFSAFLAVYLMLRKLSYTDDDLIELHDRIQNFHGYAQYTMEI